MKRLDAGFFNVLVHVYIASVQMTPSPSQLDRKLALLSGHGIICVLAIATSSKASFGVDQNKQLQSSVKPSIAPQNLI